MQIMTAFIIHTLLIQMLQVSYSRLALVIFLLLKQFILEVILERLPRNRCSFLDWDNTFFDQSCIKIYSISFCCLTLKSFQYVWWGHQDWDEYSEVELTKLLWKCCIFLLFENILIGSTVELTFIARRTSKICIDL